MVVPLPPQRLTLQTPKNHPSTLPPAPATTWLLPLLVLSLSGAMPWAAAVAVGVAGGAGGAELAEREALAPHNGSLAAFSGPLGASAGTIREALDGGVVEPEASGPSGAGTNVPVTTPKGLRSGMSRCSSPQVCLRVRLCPEADMSVLFECAAGKVCCVPSGDSATPSATPRPRPPVGVLHQAEQPQQPQQPQATQQPPTQQPRPQYYPQQQPQTSIQQPRPPLPTTSTRLPQYPQAQSPSPTPRPPRPQSPQPGAQHPRPAHPQTHTQQPSSVPHYSPPTQQQTTRPQRPQAPQTPQTQHSQQPQHGEPQRPRPTPPSDPAGPQDNRVPSKATSSSPTASPTASLLPGTDVCGKVSTENRITNGKIAELGQFPWMALLGYNVRGISDVQFLCGGTLINERYILTAAHCYSSSNRPVLVRLGEFNLTAAVDCDHNKVCAPPPQDVAVESVILHPEYNIKNIKHDIALVRLAKSLPDYSEFIRPICLPLDLNVNDDKKFKIAGWGKIDFKDESGSPVLQYTDVGGVGHDECNELQPPELQPLDPGQLCAGGDKGKDACKGDSGGPLMMTLVITQPSDGTPTQVTYQIGVVSYGPDSPCGTAPLPSIYTRVSAYVPWILSTIKP